MTAGLTESCYDPIRTLRWLRFRPVKGGGGAACGVRVVSVHCVDVEILSSENMTEILGLIRSAFGVRLSELMKNLPHTCSDGVQLYGVRCAVQVGSYKRCRRNRRKQQPLPVTV